MYSHSLYHRIGDDGQVESFLMWRPDRVLASKRIKADVLREDVRSLICEPHKPVNRNYLARINHDEGCIQVYEVRVMPGDLDVAVVEAFMADQSYPVMPYREIDMDDVLTHAAWQVPMYAFKMDGEWWVLPHAGGLAKVWKATDIKVVGNEFVVGIAPLEVAVETLPAYVGNHGQNVWTTIPYHGSLLYADYDDGDPICYHASIDIGKTHAKVLVAAEWAYLAAQADEGTWVITRLPLKDTMEETLSKDNMPQRYDHVKEFVYLHEGYGPNPSLRRMKLITNFEVKTKDDTGLRRMIGHIKEQSGTTYCHLECAGHHANNLVFKKGDMHVYTGTDMYGVPMRHMVITWEEECR
ncbi:MAG: hypothetical protein D6746_01515 [Bacteroidetes bacterium]|nr:MAG: hypothetical protein D6746_01515 [Bacteroidota bacterium]